MNAWTHCRPNRWAAASQLLGVVLCSLIVSSSGCTSLGLNLLHRSKPLLHADANHPVMDVICLWEAAEGQNLDGLPCRGFAGQVMFFAHGHSEPVLVDGKVTVYVFDDSGTADDQSRPIHEFNFEGPAWNTYGRESSLGAAYQLFIPYTRPGAHHASCAIRVKYEAGEEGRSTYSKMATVVLPGAKTERQEAAISRRRSPPPMMQRADANIPEGMAPASGIVQAGFESARPLGVEPTLQTFSSSLPSSSPRPDTARLERILRQAAEVEQTEAEASPREPVATESVDKSEEPAAAPVEARRYRL